ncbi:metal dependent phosphohydrolase [Psychromonas ingrahamii 37]|uniref:Metal dependent phosphohydrolase n=1 Tax=Psychromonas ingrahamii (strain DSM 17664 / CCUG 51855 / 37) TaxID=357804 RepID=A1SUA2_PSYIN|nr:HD domain-containing phosphohydrolase [Psychromonas ingrahamii]ABM03067.1 metal dependent phosphohydrolase [Psychromonas ingrahamii 37]
MNLKPHYQIVLVYLIVGILWISLSDWAVALLFQDSDNIIVAQNIKGWSFIAITALLLFFLIRKKMNAVTEINTQLVESYEHTMSGWVHLIDLRHRETKNHTERVTKMTLKLTKLFGITDPVELNHIKWGAMLHDLGKIALSDNVLTKPGKLDSAEWAEMKMHPQIAHDILSTIDYLIPCRDIPYCHHEKWDGSGYPQGIKGDAIPITARIFAVIDVWDALIHSRVYKSGWPEEKVLQHIKEQSGSHFDPDIVKLFLENYSEIKESLRVTDAPTSQNSITTDSIQAC